MQEVLIPFSDIPKNVLKDLILDRAIVYFPNENELYLKDTDFFKVSRSGGNNIQVSSDKVISLNNNVSVKNADVELNTSKYSYNKYLGEVSPNKQNLIIIDKSLPGSICGTIQVLGAEITATYHISVNSQGNYDISGASSFGSKDDILQVSYNGKDYVALGFVHGKSCRVYLQGFDTRNYSLSELSYTDTDLTII